MEDTEKQHLFISYATEDTPLAEWLTLRLTAEGYKVWCDRFKLLGGESYPKNIVKAIKDETFRVIAILSKNSIDKANPIKERTLASSISKKRGIDFMIPINKDGLLPHELDLMSSDITFIPFYENWLLGLIKLIKKLDSISAPKGRVDGKKIVSDWLCSNECLVNKEEKLWTNHLQICELPEHITRYSFKQNPKYIGLVNWISYKQREGDIYWSFASPDIDEYHILSKQNIKWRERHTDKQITNIVTYLVRKHIEEYCVKKGMVKNLEDRVYFPEGYSIKYDTYNGKKTYVKASFERKFRMQSGLVKIIKYHLAPTFHVDISDKENPILRVIPKLYLTESNGDPIKGTTLQKKRKNITKHWWNHEWLSRLIAICQWMSDGRDIIKIKVNDTQSIDIDGSLIKILSPISIGEEASLKDIIDSEEETDSIELDFTEDDLDEQNEFYSPA